MVLALGLSMTAAFLLVEWRQGRPRGGSERRLRGGDLRHGGFQGRVEQPRGGGTASGEAWR